MPIRKNLSNNSEAPYLMYRALTATNRNTVRMFHESNENKDFLQSTTMTISINEADNTVSMAAWNEFPTDRRWWYLPARIKII